VTEKLAKREMVAVLAACLVASIVAIGWSAAHGALLNYGDAMAHLHIARRIVDSRRPGITQLGSVWLPLPHLLLLPFVSFYKLWATGWAGVVPGALSYLACCGGLYRLARRWMAPLPALIGLGFFALNLNLLYLQTTAMSEPLFLAEMIWTACWLVEWRSALDADLAAADRLEGWIAMVLVAAVYTRYDGWVMTFVVWVAMGLELLRRGRLQRKAYWIASAAVVGAPLLWAVYNQLGFGDWLFFARGPYSAAAIEAKTAASGPGPLHPGWHNPWLAERYFIRASEMDTVVVGFARWLLPVAFLAMAWGWLVERRKAAGWSWILWFPLPFYAYSVAWGSVPIFIPTWFPHSWYNTRYGMEMLPAYGLAAAFVAEFVVVGLSLWRPKLVRWAVAAMLLLMLGNIVEMAKERPLVFVEGEKNTEARVAFQRTIPPAMRALLAGKEPGAPVLMDTSTRPELVGFTGIPLKQTINESDKYFYRDALAAPAKEAAVVLAFAGDEIDGAVKAHPEGLRAVGQFSQAGQPLATLYESKIWGQSSGNTGSNSVVGSPRGAR